MERRDFIRSLVGGVIGAAAVRTFPFRVFSFPKEIKITNTMPMMEWHRDLFAIGDIITIGKWPNQYRIENITDNGCDLKPYHIATAKLIIA